MSIIGNIFENIYDHVRRLSGRSESYAFLFLNTSLLMAYYRQQKYQQIVDRYLQDEFSVTAKTAFRLPNGDLVLSFRDTETEVLEQAFFDLRSLMSYDPLLNMPSYGRIDGNYMQVFSLETQKEVITNELKTREEALKRREKAEGKRASRAEVGEVQLAKGLINVVEMDAAHKAELRQQEDELKRIGLLAEKYRNIDMASVVRRTYLARYDMETEAWSYAFSQFDPQMRKLMTYRDQRVDADDQLLNQYLAHVLNFRLIDYLYKLDDQKLLKGMMLPVHPELILHPVFMRFDEMLGKSLPQNVYLQFRLSDIYQDYRSFSFVRRYLRRRGYRLCVQDVRFEMLPSIDLAALGMDMLFLEADADWAYYREDVRKGIIQEIQDIGADKVCLMRVEEPNVFQFGLEAGITLFGGNLVQQKMQYLKQVQSKSAEIGPKLYEQINPSQRSR